MESPVYKVAEPSALSIWYFQGQRDDGDDATDDFFLWEVSTDGAASYTPLVSIDDVTTAAAWRTATVVIAEGSDVRLRVQASDGSSTGAMIDSGIDELSICSL